MSTMTYLTAYLTKLLWMLSNVARNKRVSWQWVSHLLNLSYCRCDRSMPEFKDDWFDGILDKGTLDAVLCGPGAAANAANMLQECCR